MELHNPRTGQRMRFLVRSPELLRMETTNPPGGAPEPVHVHPHQESRAEVVSGRLRFDVGGEQRCLGPGDAITIGANVPHNFFNDGDEDAVAIQELRPALRTAEFFETYFGLAARGELDAHGMPSLLRLAVLGPEFAEEIRVTRPPWALQRLAYALLGPIARRRGY